MANAKVLLKVLIFKYTILNASSNKTEESNHPLTTVFWN